MANPKTFSLLFAAGADAARTVAWPCKIAVPIDGGKVEEQEIDAAFTIPTPDELQLYQMGETLFGKRKDLALLDAHLKDFPGLKDADGKDVPFEHAKEMLFKRPFAVDGLVAGLIAMSRGRAAKN